MSELQIAGLLAACGLAAGVLVMLVIVTVKHTSTRKPQAEDPAATAIAARGDLRQLMGELQALADQVDERIASRLTKLSSVLAETDATIADLQAKLRLLNGGRHTDLPDKGPAGPDGRPSSRHGDVMRLHGQGLDTVEIARRMRMSVGEVELVLNLQPARPEAE